MPPMLSTMPNAGIPAGLRKRATDALASTADMKQEDWRDLLGGLMKFFKEEAAEPEHAEDKGGVTVDAEHDGPWVSCMSKDGRTMYRNRNLPKTVEINGKTVDLDEDLKAHEVPELERLRRILAAFRDAHGREPTDQERVLIYQEAHDTAGTPGEKKHCEDNGINWPALQAWFRGEEAKIAKLKPENPPPDADVKPIPHGHGELEAADKTGAIERELSGVPPASGAQDRLALDRSVRSFDEDGRMRVAVTNISKANVCPYKGEEIPGWDADTKTHALGLDPEKIYMMLRPPEELAKSVKTWNGIQILKEHKPVDVNDHKKHDIVGTTGTNAEFVDPYLRNSLVFWTKEGIDLIESEEQRELSCGYHYDPDMTSGVFDGVPYDGIMRNIRGNHVALVEEGRAGPDVLVADSIANMQWAAIELALLELRAA